MLGWVPAVNPWVETTIVVSFWIIAVICVALGLRIFYAG
jgi:UDP-N-acetylmuramyl pentapeptide phosphotransferase/UDP-N-acetylglucosamine-1-phosphate transferase